MTDVEEMLAFYRARLADVERVARAVKPLGHTFDMGGQRMDERLAVIRLVPAAEDGSFDRETDKAAQAHFDHHDPARVLRAVEVKRRIVSELFDTYPEPRADGDEALWHKVGHDYARFKVIRLLVSEYDTHPGYREEWRP